MRDGLPQWDVVLLGVGHTNAHVVKMWRMNPLPDARLTCISDFPVATYSGMLPGTLAGLYEPEQMQIDLVRLCAAARARLISAEVTGLDISARQLLFRDRPPLPYDVLSIGIGSRPSHLPKNSVNVLPIKPMQTFRQRLDSKLDRLANSSINRPWRITIVGAGAGGVEIAFCLARRLRDTYGQEAAAITLVDRGVTILDGMPLRTQRLATRQLDRMGIQTILVREVTSVENGVVTLQDGQTLQSDLVLWATSATGPPELENFGLPTDERGFLLTRDSLQSTANDDVFVVGDSGTLISERIPKAGVFAVRQGPVLWENIRRWVQRRALISWRPQRSFLTLLNSGDQRAILTYKGVSVHAHWCWKLKDFIDRRFMAKYQDYTPMAMATTSPPAKRPDEKMYCGGCGSKLPADALARVLANLNNPSAPHVLIGTDQPDDIAVMEQSPGRALAATVDFFTAFLNDPFLLGRVAALNALSDMIAKGAKPRGALAMITVPHGNVAKQETFLREVLEGALRVFRPEGVPLVGGHTIEGMETTVGFTIVGEIDTDRLSVKGGLQPEDRLVLTKPLGTGVLLAANMQARCRFDWMEVLLASMLINNRDAGACASELRLRAVTDVTGFGLAGHLLEMLSASQLSAELELAAIPLLPGAEQLLVEGIESSLAPGNRTKESQIDCVEKLRGSSRYAALFDPQTSGGLLMGVPADKLPRLLEKLDGNGAVIGRVCSEKPGGPRIHIHE